MQRAGSPGRAACQVTEFARRVYDALRTVRRGRVTTYARLAKAVGVASPRAVGRALRDNPWAPWVPCHRVIASDLRPGGYRGQVRGRAAAEKLARLAAEGVRFAGGRLAEPWRVVDPHPWASSRRCTMSRGRMRTIRMLAAAVALAASAGEVTFEREAEVVRIRVGGRPLADYRFRHERFPCFHPVLAPHGAALTRAFPSGEIAGESRDHPHHCGLWSTHGDLNGHDFWSSRNGERIVHVAFLELDEGGGRMVVSNEWVAGGAVVATDRRVWRFRPTRDGGSELEAFVHASRGALRFGDTKEGSLALGLGAALQPDPPGRGRILNSEGHADRAAWSRPARWCDYSGPLGGEMVGVAIFDHPFNPRHPTGWHVRTYGLFSANPFARKSFGLLQEPETFEVPAGGVVTFRWRVWIHRGEPSAAELDRRFAEWAARSAGDRP